MASASGLQDDPSIPDGESLYRSLHPNDIKDGRISSAAFRSRPDPNISVDRSSLCSPAQTLSRHPKHIGVVQLTAQQARSYAEGVASDPREDNPAHALILLEGYGSGKLKTAARELAKCCYWVIPPHDS